MVVLETPTSGHRYSATGAVGAAFSVTGMGLVDVDVDSTGRVVAIGSLSAGATPVVVRFTATGALDTTFGASGVRGLTTPATATRIAVDASDRPYALVTLSGTGSRVDRLTTSGALDASFATGGSLSSTGTAAISPGDMAFDSSNRLLLSGFFPGVADVRGVRLVAATAPPADTTGPTITITAPLDGATYEVGQPRSAAYTCSDPSPPVTCAGTVILPGPFDVSSIGTKTFTVNARDGLGNTSTRTVTYRVVDTTAPFITPISPTNGQLIPRNAVVSITVSCVDPFLGASGLASCTSSPSGLLDTSTLGPRTITYTATDNAGNSRTQSITVQIVDRTPPTITVTAPTGRYLLGDTVFADYRCTDEPGGSSVATCTGDVPLGQPLDTSTPGTFTFRVTSTDVAGNVATFDATYAIDDRATGTLARGETLSTGGDPTETDPVETTVTAGRSGSFTIVERPVTAPAGWTAVTSAAVITAPVTEDSRPHTVALRIGSRALDLSLAINVQILSGSRVVPPCEKDGRIGPDPCVSRRSLTGDATEVTILTTKGATFLPVLAAAPVPITNVSQPMQPTIVTAPSRTFAVTYTFATAPGATSLTGVYASEPLSCTSDIGFPFPAVALPFELSGRQNRWRFEYQAPSSWRGGCRQIIVAWSDGRTDRFLVQF